MTEIRIAYVLPFDVSAMSGLWVRLQERLGIWAEFGVAADVFVCTTHTSPLLDASLPEPHQLHVVADRTSWLAANRKLPEVMPKGEWPVVYIRYGLPYPGIVALAKRFPTALEVHSDDLLEAKFRPWHYRLTIHLLRRALLRRAAGFVFVDPELEYATSYASFSKHRLPIPNGIRLPDDIEYDSARSRQDGPPRLVLVIGAAEPWQGLEKYSELAKLLPHMEFHVLGDKPSAMPPDADILHWHDRLAPELVSPFLRTMDIGVGPLNLEVVNRPSASGLKVRDYIANGLPVILAQTDPDLMRSDRSVLQLGYGFSATAEVATKIERFVNENLGRTCSAQAASSVDLRSKEENRLGFLATIAAQGQ